MVGLHGEDGPVRHQVLDGGADLLPHLLEHWTDGRTLLHAAPPVNTSSTMARGSLYVIHAQQCLLAAGGEVQHDHCNPAADLSVFGLLLIWF